MWGRKPTVPLVEELKLDGLSAADFCYLAVILILTGFFAASTGLIGKHKHLLPRAVDAGMAATSLGALPKGSQCVCHT